MASLNTRLPDDVWDIILVLRDLSLVKAYMASGLGLEFMNPMLSSMFFNCYRQINV